MSTADDFDEDITRQIERIVADPQADLSATVRVARIEAADVRKRLRRIEKGATWIAMAVLAGASGIIFTIAGASFWLGARLTAIDAVARQVDDNSERLVALERGDRNADRPQ